MPTSDLFITTPVKPTMVDTTIPTYMRLNYNVNAEDPRALKNMETFNGSPISNDAQLANVKMDINKELVSIMSQRNITSATDVKPYDPTKEVKLEAKIDLMAEASKFCDSILDFDLGKELDDLLSFKSFKKSLKGVLSGIGDASDSFNALLSCGQAATKAGMGLVKDAIPLLSGNGNIGGLSSIVSKYGGSTLKNLGSNISKLSGNMLQTPLNVKGFTDMVAGDPPLLDTNSLIGTTSKGYTPLSIAGMKTELTSKSPIGDLLNVSKLSLEMKQVTKCDNMLNMGNSLSKSLYKDDNDRKEIAMARAAMPDLTIKPLTLSVA